MEEKSLWKTAKRPLWRLAILAILVLILPVVLCLWVKNHNYLAAISTAQSIATDGITESKYGELPNLMKSLPGTRAIFTPNYYGALYGNERVKRIYLAQNKVNVDLRFTEKEDDAEKRSANIILNLGKANLSGIILFTSVKVVGNIIGQGHQKSRVQFELTDINNKKMMGPKIPVTLTETPLILRPSITEPIPTGSFQDNFDLTRVKSLTIRFIIGRYPDEIKIPASGKLIFSEILKITNLDFVSRAFPKPSLDRLTEDTLNIEYGLRKLGWKMEKNNFFVGVNYPWNNYGWDIGKNPYGLPENSGWSANEDKLTHNFQLLKEAGINIVRIYIFFDLRTGLEYKNGRLTGFDQYVRKDIESLFKIAGKSGMKIIPVLFDFGIADGQGPSEHPELIFQQNKVYFLANMVRPLLTEMDRWNTRYGHPVFAIELMNEPDNMAMLLIPGYFDSLKTWFKDLINIIHQETNFRVTLGSHSIVDMQRWWSDLQVDAWQFHFYKYMSQEHEWWPQNLKREKIKMPGIMFCGELEPYDITNNLDTLKANGYNGVLFWNWNTNDGFKLTPEQGNEIFEWVKKQKEVK